MVNPGGKDVRGPFLSLETHYPLCVLGQIDALKGGEQRGVGY